MRHIYEISEFIHGLFQSLARLFPWPGCIRRAKLVTRSPRAYAQNGPSHGWLGDDLNPMFIQKMVGSSSRVYCIFVKSTNGNDLV